MKANILILMVGLLMNYVVGVAFIYLFVLIVRALKENMKAEPVRIEFYKRAKSLGEVIKRYRTQRKMTKNLWQSL